MAPNKLSRELAAEAVRIVEECGADGFSLEGKPSALVEAAKRLGIARGTLRDRLDRADQLYKLKPKTAKKKARAASIEQLKSPSVQPEKEEIPENLGPKLHNALRGKRKTLAELAMIGKVSIGAVLDEIEALRASGVNVMRDGDAFEIPTSLEPSFLRGPTVELVSRKDNTFLFGAIGDLHAASKYTRWDVRADLYKRIAESGAQCVFDTGNWIDGEARFNKYDITAHGIDKQCRVLAENHPKIEGLHTYAVWGDDHEGWYVQNDGVDVGRYNEAIMREYGHDWTDLGFMEANVVLRNANTSKTSHLAVVHPGGGSAYALSYSIQKIVESYEGGEKPAVALYGHYHKLWAGIIRNCWVVQTGCGQDQTPFMRKRRLEAHVGGAIVGLEQDPESGAIIGMTPRLFKYFNKGFYSGRWSRHGDVTLPERDIKAIA